MSLKVRFKKKKRPICLNPTVTAVGGQKCRGVLCSGSSNVSLTHRKWQLSHLLNWPCHVELDWTGTMTPRMPGPNPKSLATQIHGVS